MSTEMWVIAALTSIFLSWAALVVNKDHDTHSYRNGSAKVKRRSPRA